MLNKITVKKLILPVLGVFGVITAFNLLFNEWVLSNYYLDYNHLFKPQDEIQKKGFLLHIANLIFSIAFCYIYSKGHEEKKSLAQGIRYGIWISLLIWLPMILTNIVYFPYPRTLEILWFVEYITQSILAGTTAAYIFNLKIKM